MRASCTAPSAAADDADEEGEIGARQAEEVASMTDDTGFAPTTGPEAGATPGGPDRAGRRCGRDGLDRPRTQLV